MRAKKVIEGLTVVAIGAVLLANTFGALSWRVWLSVFALWPLLIVAVGVDIVGKGLDREWLRAAASLLVLGGVAFGVTSSVVSGGAAVCPACRVASKTGEAFEFSEPASSAIDRGVATIRGGVGRLGVSGGDELASARGRSPVAPRFDVRRDGTTALVDVSLSSRPWVWPGPTGPTGIDVELSSDVPWDLTIQTGVAELAADLRDVTLEKARIDCGASDSVVTFGEPGGTVPVAFHAGVSSLTMRFPKDCSFRIRVTGALASIEGDGFEDLGSDAGTRTLAHGDADAEDRYEVEVKAGVSTLRVELY